jgi:hypothetical protein
MTRLAVGRGSMGFRNSFPTKPFCRADRLISSVPVHEAVILPEVEAGSDTRNVDTEGMVNRRHVSIALDLYRIKNAIMVVDEMDAISKHDSFPLPATPEGVIQHRVLR